MGQEPLSHSQDQRRRARAVPALRVLGAARRRPPRVAAVGTLRAGPARAAAQCGAREERATADVGAEGVQRVPARQPEAAVANAEAAIDAVVEMGVCDQNRVGVGGHSYGAFMAVMLLANSDPTRLLKGGIALLVGIPLYFLARRSRAA